MVLFVEWSTVAEAVFSAMQYVVLLAMVVYVLPVLLIIGVMEFKRYVEVYAAIVLMGLVCSPVVFVVMAARFLNKCFMPPSELIEVPVQQTNLQ